MDAQDPNQNITLEQVVQSELARQNAVDKRFDNIEMLLAGVAKTEDIEKFNGYVKNFLLGVTILEKSSKWILYAIITIGGLAGGFLVIKNGFVALLMWLGFSKN